MVDNKRVWFGSGPIMPANWGEYCRIVRVSFGRAVVLILPLDSAWRSIICIGVVTTGRSVLVTVVMALTCYAVVDCWLKAGCNVGGLKSLTVFD